MDYMEVDYNAQAEKWHRDRPKHHSDFCGRPEVFKIFEEIGKGKVVLDAGCGEGYFSRKMATLAEKVIGVDQSKEMIKLARQRQKSGGIGNIAYHVGDVKNMLFIPDSSIDVCVGNYVTNYMHPDELPVFYAEVARVLKPKEKFIFLMPHPIFELMDDYGEAIQHEGKENFHYRQSRGEFFPAKLKTVDGETFEVGVCHATVDDHFKGLSSAGLVVTKSIEPVFPAEIAEQYPVFKDMAGKIACMILYGDNQGLP